MKTGNAGPYGGMFKQFSLLFLILASIYMSEGLYGFKPFLNLEALLLVFGGTFLLAWTAYPLRELFLPSSPEPLLYAAGCAMAMGALATVLGIILMLVSIDDVAQVPRRMALMLSSLFFGLVLSEVILIPMAVRLAAGGNAGKATGVAGQGKRLLMGLIGFTMAGFSLLGALLALK